ncbi:helix-turn-helix domain-containing protein [Saprospiraceae bacterium]|nr:helix-turn-helix domain-containing protein [Saprospiraceae bacterium]
MDNKEFIFSTLTIDQFTSIIKSCIRENSEGTIRSKEEQESSLLTVKQAAEFLQVSKVSIHTWKKNKGLKYYRVGRRIRFKKQDLIDFANLKRKNK